MSENWSHELQHSSFIRYKSCCRSSVGQTDSFLHRLHATPSDGLQKSQEETVEKDNKIHRLENRALAIAAASYMMAKREGRFLIGKKPVAAFVYAAAFNFTALGSPMYVHFFSFSLSFFYFHRYRSVSLKLTTPYHSAQTPSAFSLCSYSCLSCFVLVLCLSFLFLFLSQVKFSCAKAFSVVVIRSSNRSPVSIKTSQ